MKLQAIGTLAGLVAALFNAPAIGQTADTVEAHIAAAKAAAGEYHSSIFDGLCMSPSAGPNTATEAPVIDAVLVAPSACKTSQSTQSVRSPRASRSTAARRARPIRR